VPAISPSPEASAGPGRQAAERQSGDRTSPDRHRGGHVCHASSDPGRKLLGAVIEGRRSALKALAYNTLGKSYFDAGQMKEARWEFLWWTPSTIRIATSTQGPLPSLADFQQPWRAGTSPRCRDLFAQQPHLPRPEYQRLAKEKGG